MPDPELLDRATELRYALFTHDTDLLQEASRRQQAGESFAGVIYAHPLRVSIRQCIDDVEIIAEASESSDIANQVAYLPL